MNRRHFLGCLAMLPVAACTTGAETAPALTLAQAQAYVADLSGAVSAAAEAYLASPSAPYASAVSVLAADLPSLNSIVQAATDAASVKGTILQILAAVSQLSPLLTPFLGPAAEAVPLAIAVLEAFVQGLSLPTGASPTPPAALHLAAMRYKP